MVKPDDFFLPAAETTDDNRFLPPSRQGNKIEPLVDGVAFFTEVEEAMAAANSSIYCAIWSMYPNTPLLSSNVKGSLKVKDWQGLLIKMAKHNKVKVRIIISDFDPVLDNGHHQRAWKGVNGFVALAAKAGLNRDQFQIICSMHPAEFEGGFLGSLLAKRALKELIAKFNKTRLEGLENSPGIWRLLKVTSGKIKMADKAEFKIRPGSHHQKLFVIDNMIGFVGGINISDFYHATPEHRGDQRTHDIFCRVEGPVVEDLERNFVSRWNTEAPRFSAFVTAANAIKLGRFKITNPFAVSTLGISKTALGKAGNAVAQPHRTLSSSISGTFPLLTLKTERDDVMQTYERAISLANEYVYIENQYAREVDVADWIIKRFGANGKLQVIVVLPIIPEELEEGKGDPLSLHGLFLQHEMLTKLRALGKNLGLYSLVQNTRAKTDKKSKNLSSFGSMRIYPHSKVLIVDDVFASIGSANVNPRGFELDSELDLGWHDPGSVRAFRHQLWSEHLGSPNGSLFATWKPADYVKNWEAIAKKNSTVVPKLRQGFVVPHDPDLAKGSRQTFPDFLVHLESQDREDTGGEIA